MTLLEIASNPWIIAAAAFVTAEVGVPLVRIAITFLRSRFGPFTGTYVSLTGDVVSGPLLLEKVICRQIGEKLIGRIEGLAVLEFDQNGRPIIAGENHENYSFNGLARDRLFTVSYSSANPRVRSSGLIVISGDDSGCSFIGQWAGSVEDQVVNSGCVWLRIERSTNSNLEESARITAFQYLENLHGSMRVDWKEITKKRETKRRQLIEFLHFGMGKTILAPHVLSLKYEMLLNNSVFAKAIGAREQIEEDT